MDAKGLVMVITGNGKGKTTSALGMMLRCLGHHKKVCVIQFMKSSDPGYGEIEMMNRLGVENYQAGAGCTWQVSAEATLQTVASAWQLAEEKVHSAQYDMVILDEVNTAMQLPEKVGKQVIHSQQMIAMIEKVRKEQPHLHLVLTGRYAKPEIIEKADLVSEINCLKHPFQNGVPAQPGVEY